VAKKRRRGILISLSHGIISSHTRVFFVVMKDMLDEQGITDRTPTKRGQTRMEETSKEGMRRLKRV
jgi:hypothetical protein